MYPNKLHSYLGRPLIVGKYDYDLRPSFSVGKYVKDFGFKLLPDITFGNPVSVTLSAGVVLQSFIIPGNSITPLASNIDWEFAAQYDSDISRTTNINIGSYTYTLTTTGATVKVRITGTNYQDEGTVGLFAGFIEVSQNGEVPTIANFGAAYPASTWCSESDILVTVTNVNASNGVGSIRSSVFKVANNIAHYIP
jgi:hypothetical protein